MTTKECGRYLLNVLTEEELNDLGGSCLLPEVVQGRENDYDGSSQELDNVGVTLLNNSLLDFPKVERVIIEKNLLNYKVI